MKADGNERITVTAIHGLVGHTAEECVKELRLMAAGARTKTPLIHAHASPSIRYTNAAWEAYWAQFETEFGLTGQPHLEVEHLKLGDGGRTAAHRHRAYLRVLPNRRVIALSSSFARSEKLSRRAEFENGEILTKGRFNSSVAATLEKAGRQDVVAAMSLAGLLDGVTPIAPTPAERAMTERCCDLAADEVWTRAHRAWCRSDSGASLVSALAEEGLILAMGESTPVVLAPGGAVHALRRAVSNGARASNANSVKKAEIDRRLAGLELRSLDVVLLTFAKKPALGAARITGLERSVPLPNVEGEILPPPSVEDIASSFVHVNVADVEAAPKALTPIQEAAVYVFLESIEGGASQEAKIIRDVADLAAEIDRMQFDQARVAASHVHLEAMRAADRMIVEAQSAASKCSRERERLMKETARARTSERLASAASETTKYKAERLRRARLLFDDLRRDEMRPTVSDVGWRGAYKAKLAGLPREFGARIRWVEWISVDRREIRLEDGETVYLMPRRATGSAPTEDVAEAMIEHAISRNWGGIELSGGTPEWREATARRAVQRGVPVSNVELRDIVRDESRKAQHREMVLEAWRSARAAIEREPDDDFLRGEFVDAVALIREMPGLENAVREAEYDLIAYDLRQLRIRENALAGTGIAVALFGRYIEGRLPAELAASESSLAETIGYPGRQSPIRLNRTNLSG
jgi:hypothetical protein